MNIFPPGIIITVENLDIDLVFLDSGQKVRLKFWLDRQQMILHLVNLAKLNVENMSHCLKIPLQINTIPV